MKLIKLSLAAMIAFGTCAVASSDTVYDAFANGTTKGELKAYYYTRQNNSGRFVGKGEIFNVGVKLDYKTDDFYGFKASVGVQTSDTPFVDEDSEQAYKQDSWANGAVLSETALSYTLGKSSVKIGRQYIFDIPFMKSSPSRLLLQSFEGVTAYNKDIPDTTLLAGYVVRSQDWTDTARDGDIAHFERLDFRGVKSDYAYSLALVNKSIPNTTITLANAGLQKQHNIIFADAKYKTKVDSIRYFGGLQYFNTKYDTATVSLAPTKNDDDSNLYSGKFGAGIGGITAYAAYTEIRDNVAAFRVAGTRSRLDILTAPIVAGGEYEESNQFAIDLKYKFNFGLLLDIRHLNVDYKAKADEANFSIFMARYAFKKSLKGLSVVFIYEDENHSLSANDDKTSWLRTSFKF